MTTYVTASPNPVAAGQYVSLEIGADNVGDATAHNVVVKAFVPLKTQFVSATSGCSLSGDEVSCPVGDMAAGDNKVFEVVLRLIDFSFTGTMQVFATVHSTGDVNQPNDGSQDNIDVYNFSHDHHITVSKAEQHLSLPAGSGIQTFHLDCPNPADIMLDGSVRVDNVDQGTGTLKSLTVLAERAEGNGYLFIVANHASGQAQGKLFGTCISKTTQAANADGGGPSHTHDIETDPVQSVTAHFSAGQHQDVKVPCNSAVWVAAAAPGYEVDGAEGTLNYSLPGYDANGKPAWDFGFTASQGGDVTFSIKCLHRWTSTTLGHRHELWLSHPDKYVNVQPNSPAGGTYDIDCSDEAKGIVAGWGLEDPIYTLGNDPQPKRRSFKLLNTSNSDKEAHLLLLCIGDRTGTDPPAPPAAVAPSATVASSGATVPVALTCKTAGCGGVVELVASASGSRAVASANRVIGRAAFRAQGKGRVVARVHVFKKYRSAVRSGRISRVTAVVRKSDGSVAKRRSIRLKRG